MRALLLAAGLGTRLRPLTDTVPKCLVPVHGRPLLGYWLELLGASGVERMLVNTHYLPGEVRDFVARSPWRDKVTLVHEEKLLGTGGTVLSNRDFFGRASFLVAHADNLTRFDVRAFERRHANRPAGVDITMMTFEADEPSSCGIVEQDTRGVVTAFHEKVAEPPGRLANAAVYVFEPAVVDFIATLGREVVDLSTEVIPRFLGRICTFHNADYHRDIGTPESLRRAEAEVPLASMPDTLTIALAQINPTVGDLDGNAELLLKSRAEAASAGADLLVFPEFAVVGYPPEDLVLRPSFQHAARRTIEALAGATARSGPALLVSAPWVHEGRLYNAALLLAQGGIAAVRFKHELPNYGVFDEKRVFVAGGLPDPVEFAGVKLGVMICEDMWFSEVGAHLASRGAEIFVVPNGSPFELDKHDVRRRMALDRVQESRVPLVYVNQVGGQDELVFDGGSFVMAADGALACQCPYWRADLTMTRWQRDPAGWRCVEGPTHREPERLEAAYQAMVLGLRDYVEKNRFPGVVLGLSGGIDSALSAAVAVDALGAARVHCVMLPSKYTSSESLDEAADCARRLGVRLDTVSIAPLVECAERTLAPIFAGRAADLTEENIQSRLRGVLLMALSNKFGPMVLTTGNKSEVSVGYATLYGDMCGGYSVLKDVYKMLVFELSRWRNAHLPEGARGPAGVVIPENTIARPPTAELRPNQKDQDSLPPYEQLDAVLEDLVENELPVADIVAKGYSFELVTRVQNMLYSAEYKRRQASPGVKVTRRNFGRDRRYPITNRFRNR